MGQLITTTHKTNNFRKCLQLLEKINHQHFLTTQRQYHELTKQIVFQKRKNRSTCIATSHCKRIMKSIDYTIDHALFYDPIHILQTNSLATLYEQGMNVLKNKIKGIKQLHKYLIKHELPFHNERYQNVLHEQIPHFLKYYEEHDLYYASYCTHDDFDYPLLDGLPLMLQNYHLRGVDFVWEYCRRLTIEQQFIDYYSSLEIQEFIRCYELQKGIKIELLGSNLCEILFIQQAFCSFLVHKNDLIFHDEELTFLTSHQIQSKDALEHVYRTIQQQYSKEIAAYLLKYQHMLYLLFEQIQQLNNLSDLCIQYQEPAAFQLQMNASCDPAIYHQLMKQLTVLQTTDDILDCLQKTPLSVHDYCDLLNTYILDDNILRKLFQQFDTGMIAILLYVSFQDDLGFDIPIQLNHAFIKTLDVVEDWQTIFLNQLLTRPEQELDMIKHMLKQLRKSSI